MSRTVRTLTAVFLLALAAAACARGSTTVEGGRTLTVGYADLGRTMTLSVGDTLSVDLARGTSAAIAWTVQRYPRSLRIATNDPARSRFSFRAVAPGAGQVLIVDSFVCPGAGSSPGGPARACPFANGVRGTPPVAGHGMTIRPFTITISVR
jgi:hypothetical protein